MRAKMAVARPLIATSGTDARDVSRTFECFDHERDGMNGFGTIFGKTLCFADGGKISEIPEFPGSLGKVCVIKYV